MSYERSKAPLALMEQIIMILVFALASAVCLQAFVYADNLSGNGTKTETASVRAQTVAEYCKANHGDLEKAASLLKGERTEEGLSVDYPEDNLTVLLKITEKTDFLEKATVEVWETDSPDDGVIIDYAVPLYSIDVAWQRGGGQK